MAYYKQRSPRETARLVVVGLTRDLLIEKPLTQATLGPNMQFTFVGKVSADE